MIRFFGNIEAKVDTKGRVFIPSQFRKQLTADSEERLIMRKDVFQDCLVLYPGYVWNEELDELLLRMNKWKGIHQHILRQYMSDLEILVPDSSGRILITKRYLQLANIQTDIRLIGVGNKIEIWSKEKTEQPFMSPEVFSAELEKLMSGNEATNKIDD
ncbi:Transcriptional regulator MraZ [termite gut metagenome]|uniref:Transcriptional regulator MraZ n=1 Tax=termite gut metagenome TaxID=433724 RepID=A0A5J4S117_9ZZZZ